jgi:hypothetical protein
LSVLLFLKKLHDVANPLDLFPLIAGDRRSSTTHHHLPSLPPRHRQTSSDHLLHYFIDFELHVDYMKLEEQEYLHLVAGAELAPVECHRASKSSPPHVAPPLQSIPISVTFPGEQAMPHQCSRGLQPNHKRATGEPSVGAPPCATRPR